VGKNCDYARARWKIITRGMRGDVKKPPVRRFIVVVKPPRRNRQREIESK